MALRDFKRGCTCSIFSHHSTKRGYHTIYIYIHMIYIYIYTYIWYIYIFIYLYHIWHIYIHTINTHTYIYATYIHIYIYIYLIYILQVLGTFHLQIHVSIFRWSPQSVWSPCRNTMTRPGPCWSRRPPQRPGMATKMGDVPSEIFMVT